MAKHVQIEPLGDHEYLVRVREGADAVECRFQASAAVLDQLSVPGADEMRVVAETATFLTERQPVIDLPPMVDLDDVAAAYGDDYLKELERRMTAP